MYANRAVAKMFVPATKLAFALVVARGPGLVPGGFNRPRRADAPSVLDLVAVEEGEVAAYLRCDLRVDFRGVVLEQRAVELIGDREVMNVGSADSAPRPEPILEHRAADVEARVVVTIRAVTFAGNAAKLQRRLRRDIGTLQSSDSRSRCGRRRARRSSPS